ncbi:STAS domain-containing protein [Carboxylicivirga caseinilyticus]|uniref:STAS domain-containing protein n=1 Tax=Carboxylicivirga caseinilyticus TaxID=3417572 RepID=UPI002AA932DE|nr:STAS domain-containing protein [uncultured Carboxylicivirga sp.]MCU4165033.1 STAS domain-containing protein [Marinilabiliaceae bacterium A049]
MDFKIDKLDGFTLVQVLKEKLDTHIAPTLKSELVLLSGNGEKNILLDLGKCNYCDSSGLSAILVANRLCKNADGVFVLAGLQPAVERLISVSQLDSVLNIAPSLNDGTEMIRKAIDSN